MDTTREVNVTRPFRMLSESIKCTHTHITITITIIIITNTFSSMSRQRREMFAPTNSITTISTTATNAPYTQQNVCDSLVQQQQVNANKRRIT